VDSELVARLGMNEWPAQIEQAGPAVQQAYQYAAGNPDSLRYIPCYCGCVTQGHQSNLDCYVRAQGADGTITLDPHAIGCGVCISTTLDVERLRGENVPMTAIRETIDRTYGSMGRGTQTPWPPAA
jgi:hypothetical protein